MELVIVIAIFGILLGVITPAWANYLRRSKFRANNQKSKAVFNAAQVVVTDLEFAERKFRTQLSRVGGTSGIDASEIPTLAEHIYIPVDTANPNNPVDWCYYWNGASGSICDASGTPITTGASAETLAEWNEKLGNSIRRIVSDEMVYKIWIRDYQIQAVSCAERANSRYIGAHPVTVFELEAEDVDTDTLRNTNVRAVDLTWFDLDNTNNGTGITVNSGDEAEAEEGT